MKKLLLIIAIVFLKPLYANSQATDTVEGCFPISHPSTTISNESQIPSSRVSFATPLFHSIDLPSEIILPQDIQRVKCDTPADVKNTFSQRVKTIKNEESHLRCITSDAIEHEIFCTFSVPRDQVSYDDKGGRSETVVQFDPMMSEILYSKLSISPIHYPYENHHRKNKRLSNIFEGIRIACREFIMANTESTYQCHLSFTDPSIISDSK